MAHTVAIGHRDNIGVKVLMLFIPSYLRRLTVFLMNFCECVRSGKLLDMCLVPRQQATGVCELNKEETALFGDAHAVAVCKEREKRHCRGTEYSKV